MKLEVSSAMARARAWGHCEGCGLSISGRFDPHHRKARGAGGVHRDAAAVANDVRNLLALCRICHDRTEHADSWAETEALGWRVPSWRDPFITPCLIYTANGYGWWLLTPDGGYLWADREPSWRIPTRSHGPGSET